MTMREPAFWSRQPDQAGAAARLLWPLSVAYGAIAARRMAQPGLRVGVPVICVGNFTLGGTGKTPSAITLAQILSDAGGRPVLLSRGYGGSLHGPVRVDPGVHSAAEVGDEPMLLARSATAVVARDRVAGARAAMDAGATAIVMDDGLQNPSLAKTLSIAVIDGRMGLGNGRVFPAGPLRAPLAAQLKHVHALLIVGSGADLTGIITDASRAGVRIFHARLEPDRNTVYQLRPQKVLAFAGIGSPDKFFATLAASGIDAPVQRSFPDHHRYTAKEAAALLAEADARKLDLLTTEKDIVRIMYDPALSELAARSKALPVALALNEAAEFRGFVLSQLRR